MGHRANYVIVEPPGYALYHSHWGALTAPTDLFWGPDEAARFIRRQERRQPDEWLDDIWAEGGALLDPQAKRLILFGGDDLSLDVPLRRLYLTLLAAVWDGWHVSWAYEGLADFADHLGLDRSCVLSDPNDAYSMDGPATLAEEFPPEVICSLQREDGTAALYPLASLVELALPRGPRLAEDLAALDAVERLDVDMGDDESPCGGLHIDPATRSLTAWLAAPAPDMVNRMSVWWPDWAFAWQKDRYETQHELTGGRLVFTEPSSGALIEKLAGILLPETDRTPLDEMFRLIGRLEDQGHSVEVNPKALAHEVQNLPADQRRRVFEAALARWRQAS